ncbi:hypothetical protein [uncultured Amnibacterium sp.]|uniref:hypothetical protein n=1 Tax=uncultured Amnibacterium sp. TaxID=1631851 RepID=UPI0035CB7288
MKHIAYGEMQIGTDDRLADLVLRYATLLARSGSADTVTIPGRIGSGDVEAISILVGPASQITAWSDDEPFESDVTAATADLERRIGAMSTTIPTSSERPAEALDDFDDLA